MVKKQVSKQNIAIIVLCILLLLSIGFGATYSYFNTKTEELISGEITTITMSIGLTDANGNPYDNNSNKFIIHSEDEKVVPGQPLKNTVLKIKNESPTPTYAMLAYTLTIKNNNGEIDTTKMDAMDIRDPNNPGNLDPVVGEGWRKYIYRSTDGKMINCLVYLGNKNQDLSQTVTMGEGYGIFPAYNGNTTDSTKTVLYGDCLKVPTSWENEMQGRTVTLTFWAFVLQSEALTEKYVDIANANIDTRKAAIAKAIVNECGVENIVFKHAEAGMQ